MSFRITEEKLLLSESFSNVHSLLQECEIDCPTHLMHGKKIRRETHTYFTKNKTINSVEVFYYLLEFKETHFNSLEDLLTHYKLNIDYDLDDKIQKQKEVPLISDIRVLPKPEKFVPKDLHKSWKLTQNINRNKKDRGIQ